MCFNSWAVRCLGLLLILPGGCTVDRLSAQGRPCSASVSCGPDMLCGPAGRCVPRDQLADGALDALGRRDGALDAPWRDGPGADVPLIVDQRWPDVGEDLLPEAATPNDTDADKIPDSQDNCVYKPNTSQTDSDKDKVGDVCDNCPKQPNQGQVDGDNDTVGDICDNCPLKANKDQKNLDGDAHGDLCDADRDGDGVPNDIDPYPDTKDIVLHYKQPPAANDLETFGGAWSSQGGAYCQSQTGAILSSNYRARLKPAQLSATDVLAQSRFSIKATGTSALYWPGAGLIARVSDISNNNHDAYACYVDLKNLRLVIGRYSNSNWNLLKNNANNSVTSAASYTLRLTVKGSTIGCELVGGAKITDNHSQHTTGTVGFSTYRASVCYDYLLVLPAP